MLYFTSLGSDMKLYHKVNIWQHVRLNLMYIFCSIYINKTKTNYTFCKSGMYNYKLSIKIPNKQHLN